MLKLFEIFVIFISIAVSPIMSHSGERGSPLVIPLTAIAPSVAGMYGVNNSPYRQQMPYGGFPPPASPYGGYPQQAPPYGGFPQQAPPYGGFPQQAPPYGGFPQQAPPYGGFPQPAPPYGAPHMNYQSAGAFQQQPYPQQYPMNGAQVYIDPRLPQANTQQLPPGSFMVSSGQFYANPMAQQLYTDVPLDASGRRIYTR